MERERKATQEAQAALKEAKRALRERDSEIRKLRTQIGPATQATERRNTPPKGAGPPTPPTTNRRKLLKAPPGLLGDDPKTLDHWLRTENVQLLVDGYNVSKSVTGFAHLSLEDQRKRVVQAVNRLARKNGLVPIVVFDGAQAPPVLARRGRGPAVVEYSAGEIADDHLIARLVNLPSDPVVFVTNDKELQSRAQALGATIATSGQLLALAR
jgi:predicted RNA-binding protein with PIN domain